MHICPKLTSTPPPIQSSPLHFLNHISPLHPLPNLSAATPVQNSRLQPPTVHSSLLLTSCLQLNAAPPVHNSLLHSLSTIHLCTAMHTSFLHFLDHSSPLDPCPKLTSAPPVCSSPLAPPHLSITHLFTPTCPQLTSALTVCN